MPSLIMSLPRLLRQSVGMLSFDGRGYGGNLLRVGRLQLIPVSLREGLGWIISVLATATHLIQSLEKHAIFLLLLGAEVGG